MKLSRPSALALALLLVASAMPAIAATPEPVKRQVTFTGEHTRGQPGMQKPRMIKSVPPVYPRKFRYPGNQAQAIVEFIINTKGMTEQVQYSSASAEPFGEAACAAVRQWRFEPATLEGRPVNLRAIQRIDFNVGSSR
jgi:TonB family protein